MNNTQLIIKEICEELGINFRLVSKDWIMILEKDNKVKYVVGHKYPLNDQSSGKLCDDKYAVYEVMSYFNIPVVEHYLVYKKYNKDKVVEYASKYSNDMVVKDNLGTCGNDMYHTHGVEELLNKLDLLLIKNDSVSISPYYDIKTEYRNIILNDKVELLYGKKKPIVVGDGISTIYELLCKFNPNYFSKIKGSDLDKVLIKDDVFEYNWQFNLSKGSMPFFIDDQTKENIIKDMALRIAKKLGIKFASIDIIELYDGSYMLLEVNSGVMMDNFSKNMSNGKEIAKGIYTKVLNEMFND